MQFSSNRDGALKGTINAQPAALEVSTSSLSPGDHRISFSATDSGGLTSTQSILVTVAEPLHYAAKFLCGKPPEGAAAAGIYFTAINVHNPLNAPISFQKRFSVARAEQTQGDLTRFLTAKLDPHGSFRIECLEIFRTTDKTASFLEGFVILRSPHLLDVVAVYSAADRSGFVKTLEVETVKGQRLPIKLPDLVPEATCDLSITIRNLGEAEAGPSTTTVELGSRKFNLDTPTVSPGAAVVIPLTAPLLSKDFELGVTVDSEDKIPESAEINNVQLIRCVG
jgi:hypothetical protein